MLGNSFCKENTNKKDTALPPFLKKKKKGKGITIPVFYYDMVYNDVLAEHQKRERTGENIHPTSIYTPEGFTVQTDFGDERMSLIGESASRELEKAT